LPTLYLEWGNAFALTSTGSLQLASGWDEVRQRILRRLLTTPQLVSLDGSPIPAEYIFDPAYGVGLRQRVGGLLGQRELQVLRQQVLQAVLQDPGVDQSQMPFILVRPSGPYAVSVLIEVTLATGSRGQISLSLT
jgi:hypothetical protein